MSSKGDGPLKGTAREPAPSGSEAVVIVGSEWAAVSEIPEEGVS
jgi:hypothetical protein